MRRLLIPSTLLASIPSATSAPQQQRPGQRSSCMAARLIEGQDSTAPSPLWILRHHSPAPVTALAFHHDDVAAASSQSDADDSDSDSDDDDDGGSSSLCLLAGDQDGRVSLTSATTYRPSHFWQAHAKGSSILGVAALPRGASGEQGYHRLVTHGRDHKIHIWRARRSSAVSGVRVTSSTSGGEGGQQQHPELIATIEVNALNFCRFSLLYPAPQADQTSQDDIAAIAVPHTLESGWIDVYSVALDGGGATSSRAKRLHTAIGKGVLSAGGLAASPAAGAGGSGLSGGVSRAPIAMSLHLVRHGDGLAILAGYEDGAVRLWKESTAVRDGEGASSWSLVWQEKVHRETVLSTALSTSNDLLISTSADDRLALFAEPMNASKERPKAHLISTSKQGRSSLAMLSPKSSSSDANPPARCHIFVVGGWDGRARLYRASPAAPGADAAFDVETTAVLRCHKESVQAVALAGLDGDDERDLETLLVAVAAKDGRISLWKHRVELAASA